MIGTLEEISLNALPALQTLLYDGWVVRLGKGYSRRANSVQTYGSPTLPLDEKIAYCETLYRRNNLPVVFKLTPASQPPHLDEILEARGYHVEGRTMVQTCNLASHDDVVKSPGTLFCEICETLHGEWFDQFCRMNNPNSAQREALGKMLRLILPRAGFALLKDEHGVRACGLGVLQEKYLGLFDIVVDEEVRRQGYGTRLVSELLAWGQANGAQIAYLQVVANNEPAVKLYARLGFVEQYCYWYRVRV